MGFFLSYNVKLWWLHWWWWGGYGGHDDDDCICMICMIINLNSPSVFRMWELMAVCTVIWLWCSLAYLAAPSNSPDIAVRLEIRPNTLQGCCGIRQHYPNGLWDMQTFTSYVNKQIRLYIKAWLICSDIFIHISVRFPVVHRLLVFSRLTRPFTPSSHVKSPPPLHNPLYFLYLLYFGSSSSSSHCPVYYYLRPSAILHAYYVSIPFNTIAVHSLQNRLCYPPFPLMASFLS